MRVNHNINFIVNIRYHKYYKNEPQRKSFKDDKSYKIALERFNDSNYYRSKKSFDFISYLQRPSATQQLDDETKKIIDEVEKDVVFKNDFLEYASHRPGAHGKAFNAEGPIDEKKTREALRNTKSTIWTGVLSFTKEYGDLYCSNTAQARKLIRETLNDLFKGQGLQPNNVDYYCMYHTNNGYPHIHFVYWEKEPLIMGSNGKLRHSNFKVPGKAINDFKSSVAMYCNRQMNNTKFSLRDVIRKNFRSDNIEDNNLNRFLQLENDLGPHKSQYAKLEKNQRAKVNTFIDEFVDSQPELKKLWNQYINELNDKQRDIIKLHKDNKIPLSAAGKMFSQNRINELYSRCGNEVLKSLKIICDAHKKYQNEKIFTYDKKYNTKSSNNKIEIRNRSNSRSYLKKLLKHLISDQSQAMGKNINDALKEFYKDLLEKGDASIYE